MGGFVAGQRDLGGQALGVSVTLVAPVGQLRGSAGLHGRCGRLETLQLGEQLDQLGLTALHRRGVQGLAGGPQVREHRCGR